MTYFNQDIFKNILSYCGRTVEEQQRYLWNRIAIRRGNLKWNDDDELPYCITYDGMEFKDIIRMRPNGVYYTKYCRPIFTRIIQYTYDDVEVERDGVEGKLTTVNLTRAIELWRLIDDIDNFKGKYKVKKWIKIKKNE